VRSASCCRSSFRPLPKRPDGLQDRRHRRRNREDAPDSEEHGALAGGSAARPVLRASCAAPASGARRGSRTMGGRRRRRDPCRVYAGGRILTQRVRRRTCPVRRATLESRHDRDRQTLLQISPRPRETGAAQNRSTRDSARQTTRPAPTARYPAVGRKFALCWLLRGHTSSLRVHPREVNSPTGIEDEAGRMGQFERATPEYSAHRGAASGSERALREAALERLG
jgi:hypothetical protein